MTDTPAPELLIDTPEPGIRLLTLNRPDANNALRTSLLRAIAEAVAAADADPELRVVVITGGPQIFAAGADIKELAGKGPLDVLRDPRVDHWNTIGALRKPLIAAVNGLALGAGNELVLHCDIVVAADDARFGQPEINVGVMPGAGGTYLLARAVGKAVAMKMALTGDPLPAREAFAAGLVSEIVPAGEVLARALELAGKIARKPPVAAQLIKEVIGRGTDLSLHDARALERKCFTVVFGTEDKREGLSAFIDKRKPAFTGR